MRIIDTIEIHNIKIHPKSFNSDFAVDILINILYKNIK